MGYESDYQSIIEQCNAECHKCVDDFEKDGIPFSPSMCKYCKTGFMLHNALCKLSTAEQKWDDVNWGSSKWEDVYSG